MEGPALFPVASLDIVLHCVSLVADVFQCNSNFKVIFRCWLINILCVCEFHRKEKNGFDLWISGCHSELFPDVGGKNIFQIFNKVLILHFFFFFFFFGFAFQGKKTILHLFIQKPECLAALCLPGCTHG